MTTVFDVAAYILRHAGEMSAMKLQKLTYYCQAWSLVWDDQPLFPERFEAWANGPVCPELYAAHRGHFVVSPAIIKGDPDKIAAKSAETIDAVLGAYGDKTAAWLSGLTHAEDPWRLARAGLNDGVRGTEVISIASMAEYYGGL